MCGVFVVIARFDCGGWLCVGSIVEVCLCGLLCGERVSFGCPFSLDGLFRCLVGLFFGPKIFLPWRLWAIETCLER